MRRFTNKELKEMSDIEFAIACVQDARTTNHYSPKRDKINKTLKTLTMFSVSELAIKLIWMPLKEIPKHINDEGLTDLENRIIKWRLSDGK